MFSKHQLFSASEHQEKARRMEEEILYGSKPVTHGPKRFAGNTPTKTPNSKIRKVHVYFFHLDVYCVQKSPILHKIRMHSF